MGRPKGYRHTEESKAKMRDARAKRTTQQTHSPETRAKIGAGSRNTRLNETIECPRGCGLVSNSGAIHRHVQSAHEFVCRITDCPATRHKAMGLCAVHWGIDKQCRKYGYTVEVYYQLAELQLNQCEICKRFCIPKGVGVNNRRKDVFTLDHDHVTGEARALLCMNCNLGIGHFYDDPDVMDRAGAYVRHHRGS